MMRMMLLSLMTAAAAINPSGPARNPYAPTPSDIQAVCHIDMKRGPDIEGVILLGRLYPYRGSYYWDANGFYFTRADGGSSAILFDKYYRYIKNGEITERDEMYRTWIDPPVKPEDVIAWPKHDRVYFLYARLLDNYDPDKTASFATSIDSTSRPFIYRAEFVERFPVEYELLDYIPVYPKIPDEVALRGAKSVTPLFVPLREIREFRILLRLSEKWAYDVDAARHRAERRHANVDWFNASSLPEFRSVHPYSPWENHIPPDSTRIRIDHPRRINPFDVEGLCHIETVDSQVVEGAVLIATDVRPDEGYENIPETNGFYFADDRGRFGALLMPGAYMHFIVTYFGSNRLVSLLLEGEGWGSSPPYGKNYYLKDVTIEKYGKARFREVKSEIVNEGSTLVLKRYVENRYPNAFEMLDCIPVYTEIPSEVSLRMATSVQPVCVPISKIRDFELEENPSSLWWTRIEHVEFARWGPGQNPDNVRWYIGPYGQGIARSWIKPTFIYNIPKHPGLDLSNAPRW